MSELELELELELSLLLRQQSVGPSRSRPPEATSTRR